MTTATMESILRTLQSDLRQAKSEPAKTAISEALRREFSRLAAMLEAEMRGEIISRIKSLVRKLKTKVQGETSVTISSQSVRCQNLTKPTIEHGMERKLITRLSKDIVNCELVHSLSREIRAKLPDGARVTVAKGNALVRIPDGFMNRELEARIALVDAGHYTEDYGDHVLVDDLNHTSFQDARDNPAC